MSDDRLDLEKIEARIAKAKKHGLRGAMLTINRLILQDAPALVARVRELEGERSDKAIWETVRILELEEEAIGLRAVIAELEVEVADWEACKGGCPV